MKVVVGIDLGSTTTKAVLLDEQGRLVGRGITNSRSNYEVACAVAREEALTAARFTMLERAVGSEAPLVKEAFRLELYLDGLASLRQQINRTLKSLTYISERGELGPAAADVLDAMVAEAPALYGGGEGARKSDFFRDLAGAGFMSGAERVTANGKVRYERLVGLFDRAILDVETELQIRDFGDVLRRASKRVAGNKLMGVAEEVARTPIEEVSFVGTGYGRQTLPFPKAAVRSEILCHGRGAHRVFPGTRTVLDIGGQDTKAIQVDDTGVVTSFQMNDRCAAGCGRYLGYIADELNLGLHELGPLALQAHRTVKVNSTCTVFAGAELRERLALGERREDILAGLHRSIMLRAMSLLARSGGVANEFTFTGGVCKNPMATRVLEELVGENYSDDITLNIHPDSIYMGALGAALFGLDDVQAGRPAILPTFVQAGGASMSRHLTAGIDPGAASVKVVIARSNAGAGAEILASSVQRLRRRKLLDVVDSAFNEACETAGVKRDAFDYIATTGDGDGVTYRTGHFYSMTTHARGALFLDPEARAALDVGALHARALRMNEDGRVISHRMTSQCASGSGQFVENIARYLGVPLDDVGKLSTEAAASRRRCRSICAVLAETDVINMVARGISTPDILKGIHLSIAGRLVQLLRAVGGEGTVILTGGLSRDEGLVAAVQELLAEERTKKRKRALAEVSVKTHPDAILAGAIGAALLGAYRTEQLARRGVSVGVVAAASA